MPIPALIMGGAAVGSTLYNNIFGKKNQDAANAQNLKINQMNNEFNERMMNKQNAWNLEQWQRETDYNDRVRAENNAYNSAYAQVQRFRQAGLNPTIMMSGQGAGTAQGGSTPSTSSGSASASPAQGVQAFHPNINLGTDLGSLYTKLRDQSMQQGLIKEQQEQLRIQNELERLTFTEKAAQVAEDLASKRMDNSMKKMLEGQYMNILNGQVKVMDAQARQADSQAEINATQKLLLTKELDTFAQKFGEESALRIAQKTAIMAQAGLSRQQIQESIAREAFIYAQKTGQDISNDQMKRMTDSLVEKAMNEAKWSRYAPNPYIGFQRDQEDFAKYWEETKGKTMDAWKKYIYKPWIRPLQRSFGLYF